MDLEPLVRNARQGDVKAFVELTRGYQHLAFGSALALVHDLQQAEDVVQEAFLAAWSALPKLAEPAAFPAWLRSIVRHQAHRVLRRRHVQLAPLEEASELPSPAPTPDHCLEQHREAATALAAIAGLPATLREPATLFFIHECSHQDIAAFLDIPVTKVNNRLHRARSLLQQRIPTMTDNTLRSHGLPDDFANRIGRLVAARSELVDVVFDPSALPDLLSELLVSDEANKRAVSVQVVQRPGEGTVRGIATEELGAVPRGATVLNTGQQTPTPACTIGFERIAPLLLGHGAAAGGKGRLIRTGIKVIDVMCPLLAGGSLVLVGEHGTGLMVVMEELVRRLSGGADRLSLFVLIPPLPADWTDPTGQPFSISGTLKRVGYSEGTVGSIQTFFLRGQDLPWSAERLQEFAAADTVIQLSREVAAAGIYPALDLRTSRSRLLETGAVGEEHRTVAAEVRAALSSTLWRAGDTTEVAGDPILGERARKLQNYFAQPFYVAEPFSNRPGTQVEVDEALRTCREILEGRYDDIPEKAFYFTGGIDEIRNRLRTTDE